MTLIPSGSVFGEQVTISQAVTTQARLTRQTSCPGHFAVVRICFEPDPGERRIELVYASSPAVPEPVERFADAILSGLREAAAEGKQFGHPVVGFRATLQSARFHPVDSRAHSFEEATIRAFTEMLAQSTLIPLPAT